MVYLKQCTSLIIIIVINLVVGDNYHLSVIHFSDLHSRYAPIDNLSGTCEGPSCIGGFSRLYSTIKTLKQQNPDALVLNAGDNFQGTLWYIVHKWNVTQHFLNKVPLDAITLGNHEFDDGIDGLVPYLRRLQFPVVVSNIDSALEPRLSNLYNKSVVIEKNGKRIGVIGVLTTTTKSTSHTENLTFQDESQSVNQEAKRLEETGVFTNIVLSHCGYEADIEIAQKTSSKITVIVGGHTDTFLYSTFPSPGPDKPSGPYPTVVLNRAGKKVLIVHASAYTKYLGNFTAVYDDLGDIVEWDGAPIFLDNKIPGDSDIDAELAQWKKAVDLDGAKIVGSTLHTMQRKPCRSEECLLGNFATDAMIFHYNSSNVTIAMIHGGGMRAGIEAGNITFSQLTTTFPFQDTINRGCIKGGQLREILETFMDDKHLEFPHIIQVSGVRVVFNTSRPEGHRVQSLEACSEKCEDVVADNDYQVLLPTFLTDTDFNPLFKKYLTNKSVGERDTDVYAEYLKVKSPLAQKVEGRITIVQ